MTYTNLTKMKPTSLLLFVILLGLMLLPFWYMNRTESLGNILTGTYGSSWNTIWHYSTESNQNKTILIWTTIFSIFAIASFLNFFGMKLPLALLIGIISTIILMFGLSFIHPTQITNIIQNNTSVIK